MNKIYLSPSVQQYNKGYNTYKTEEIRMNQLADSIEKNLESYDIEIKRNNPETQLSEIVKDSNEFEPNLHIALHSNANDGNSRGCEIFCHKFGTSSHAIAKIFYDDLSAITPTKDRGVKQGYNFYGEGRHMYELYKTTANAILIEVAFHDNKEDATWIVENIELIARTISKSILQILNIEKSYDEFTDIDNHWAKNIIEESNILGFVRGYPDNTFRPNEPITRAEATVINMKVFNKVEEIINILRSEMFLRTKGD